MRKVLAMVASIVVAGFGAPALSAPMLADPASGVLALLTSSPLLLDQIDGLAFDANRNLFGALERDNATGGVVYVDRLTGNVTTIADGIVRADQIAFHAPSATFFVTSESRDVNPSTSERLYQVTPTYQGTVPTGGQQTSRDTSLSMFGLEGVVVLDSAYGNLNPGDLVVGEDPNGRLFTVEFAGSGTLASTLLVGAGLQRPEGFASGTFGGAHPATLYVAETDANRVATVASDGTVAGFGSPQDVDLFGPDNLEFGPDGMLYVTEDRGNGEGRIVRIAADGSHEVFASGFEFPQGLVFDTNGDLYISEQGTSSIYRVTFVPLPPAFGLLAAAMALAAFGRLRAVRARAPG